MIVDESWQANELEILQGLLPRKTYPFRGFGQKNFWSSLGYKYLDHFSREISRDDFFPNKKKEKSLIVSVLETSNRFSPEISRDNKKIPQKIISLWKKLIFRVFPSFNLGFKRENFQKLPESKFPGIFQRFLVQKFPEQRQSEIFHKKTNSRTNLSFQKFSGTFQKKIF